VIREIVGVREDTIDVAEGARLETILDGYSGRFPRLRDMLPSIVIALNQQFANPATPVSEGDEIAFLPPVSGGSAAFTHSIAHDDGHLFALTRDPIDGAAIARRILRGEDGAFVNFEGVTRNHSKGRATQFLEYECYEPMAIQVMATIGIEIVESHAIGRIAMIHRLGRVEIGETSVAIIVTAPHRKPAFEAALEGINRLKRTVPIWKKEFFVDGEVWVDGEWDESVIKARA
jgi:molybdopterin synthase catalytic subunit/molybdopterin converting factor small subunit